MEININYQNMKAHYLMLGLGLVALMASCSHDSKDEPVRSDKAITFTAAVPQSAYRSLDDAVTTTGSINTFRVYGFVEGYETPYMNGVEVVKNNGVWGYSPMQFWPVGKTMNFYSISPAIVTDPAAADNIGMDSSKPDIPNFKNTFQTDLLYGVNMGLTDASSSQVKINFRHALARVDFLFKSKEGQSIVFKADDIALVNICNTGDFKFPRTSTTDSDIEVSVGKWAAKDKGNMTLNSTPSDFIGKAPVQLMSDNNQFVIPQDISMASETNTGGMYLRVHGTIYDEASKLQTWPLTGAASDIYVPINTKDGKFKPGYRYVFTVSIGQPNNEGWIQFDQNVTVDEYGNSDESAVNK